jgi:hypothetical protein
MGKIYLNREITFRKWVELGTLKNVGKWYKEQRIISKTGKPFSEAAISYAARRWVCFNSEEARKYYNQFGWYPSDDDWNKYLVRTAIKIFHLHKRQIFEDFLDENNLRDKYGYILGEGSKS